MTQPRPPGRRWLAFNAVGLAGCALQTAILWWLVAHAGTHYLVASALAVEIAIVHNFFWHTRWTWRDRAPAAARRPQLARFNAVHGATAVLHLACMIAAVERGGVPYLPASVLSAGLCSVLNFAISHTMVFAAPARAARRTVDGRVQPVAGGLRSGRPRAGWIVDASRPSVLSPK